MTITQTARPFVLCEAEVVLAQRLSPSFVRVHLAAPELAEFGTVGPSYDQRIKLVFPHEGGRLPVLGEGQDWYAEWLALPEAERGHMRTYTVRDVLGSGPDTRRPRRGRSGLPVGGLGDGRVARAAAGPAQGRGLRRHRVRGARGLRAAPRR